MNRFGTVIASILGILLVLAGPASAQPGYGEGGPAVGLSATTSGDTITATGTGFAADEPVTGTVYSDPVHLGTKNAASGMVSFTFSVSNLAPGEHRVVLSAESGSTSSAFTVSRSPADGEGVNGGVVTGGGGVGGGVDTESDDALAYTGSDLIIPLGIVGLVLVTGGGLAVLSGRRRRDRSKNRA